MLKDKYEKFKLEMQALKAAQLTRRVILVTEHEYIETRVQKIALAIARSKFPNEWNYEVSDLNFFIELLGVEISIVDMYGGCLDECFVSWEEIEEYATKQV